MTKEIKDMSSSERSGMKCPECWTKGLVKSETYARQHSDNEKTQIINATSCPDPDCIYHDGGTTDPGRVPPEYIKKQYSPNSKIGLPSFSNFSFSTKPIAAGLIILLAFGAVISGAVPLMSGNGGPVETNNTTVKQVTTPTPTPTPASGTNNNSNDASTADNQISTQESVNKASISKLPDSVWSAYQTDDGYLIAAQTDSGKTIYLTAALTTNTEPYTYESRQTAINTIRSYEEYLSGSTTAAEEFTYVASSNATSQDVSQSLKYTSSSKSSGSSSSSSSSQSSSSSSTWQCQFNCGSDDSGSNSDDSLSGNESEGEQSNNDISGQVTDSNGDGVEGATAHLYSQHYTATTNKTGHYTFEEVPTGKHHLNIEPPVDSSWAATGNVTINVTETKISMGNDTESAKYLAPKENEIAQNKIDFTLPQAQQIQGTGSGSKIASKFDIKNPLNADDITVSVSPAYNGAESSTTAEGSSISDTLTISSTKKPTNQTLGINGLIASETKSVTKTGDSTVNIKGGMKTQQTQVQLIGRETTNTRTVTGSGAKSIQVENKGNVESDTTVKITGGQESSKQESLSGTGDGTLENDGNVKTTANIDIHGETTTLGTETTSSSFTGSSGDMTINVGGNEPAKNVQVTIKSGEKLNDVWDFSQSDGDTPYTYVSTTSPTSYTGTYEIDYNVYGDARSGCLVEDGEVDISLTIGDESWNKWMSQRRSCYRNDYDFDRRISGTKTKTLQSESISAVADSYGNRGPERYRDESYSSVSIDLDEKNGLGASSVSVNGDLENSKVVGPSESKTINIGTLEPGSHTISIAGANNAGGSITASWDEQSSTSSLSVDANGDGNAEISRSTLKEDETVTTTVELSPGETTLDISANGPTPDWDATFPEKTATQDVKADLDDDGTNELTQSDTLGEGETISETVSVSPGEETIDISAKGSAPNYEVTVTDTYATEKPEVNIGNEATISEDTILEDGKKASISVNNLNSGTHPVTTSTTEGPTPKFKIQYLARAAPDQATVTINGIDYKYPEDFDESGELNGYIETEISGLTDGVNSVSTDVPAVNGVQPEITQNIQYKSYTDQSSEPEIILITPSGTTYTKTIPDDKLKNGKLQSEATVDLPPSLFETGEHTVVVKTPDKTAVDTEITGTTANYQGLNFNPASEVSAPAPIP
jgi:hypothetical protein